MTNAKPLQIKLGEDLLTKVQVYASHEGFRSAASMAYYALIQFVNELEENKFKSFSPNEEERIMIRESNRDIEKGKTQQVDPDNIKSIFK